MSTIQNLQDHIGELQQALRERNETIAKQNRELSELKAANKKLRKELEAAAA